MITQYGMSDKFGLIGLESIQHRYLDGRAVSNCGEATSAEIDQEVMKMLKDSYDKAKQLLKDHRDTLDKIAAFLIEKETITGKEFMKIFREAEGLPPVEEDLILDKQETALDGGKQSTNSRVQELTDMKNDLKELSVEQELEIEKSEPLFDEEDLPD